jgi:hypothetical protein
MTEYIFFTFPALVEVIGSFMNTESSKMQVFEKKRLSLCAVHISTLVFPSIHMYYTVSASESVPVLKNMNVFQILGYTGA